MATVALGAPTTINLCYTRGDSRGIVFTVRDENGAALDVSSNTFQLVVNSEEDSDDTGNVVQFTLSHTFVTDGTDGQIRFAPTTTESNIVAETYFYDMRQLTPTVHTLATGTFQILTR